MRTYIYFFILISMLCSGCGSKYWYSKDKSYIECKNDFMDCRVQCGRYIQNDYSMNDYSIKYEEKCMRKKGYRLVGDGSLPMDAKRRPADLVYKEKYGIAGCLETKIEPATIPTEDQ